MVRAALCLALAFNLRSIWLYPLATPLWKPVLGLRIGGKMLDEWIASAPLLRRLAFRHLVVVRKR